uniref:Uncharacterized protein LOC105649658 n=1 Tax=Rhizophora mucronata TaxID=61149 RepID=A0A2P2LGB0_RHIMU
MANPLHALLLQKFHYFSPFPLHQVISSMYKKGHPSAQGFHAVGYRDESNVQSYHCFH